MTRIFVVNVGVNAADAAQRKLRSARFDDGEFELLPIKEPGAFASAPCARRYEALLSWTGRMPNVGAIVPPKMRHYAAHADPDFESLTYGDINSSRASNLATVQRGDELWFVARLWAYDGVRFSGRGDFFFVGLLSITHNVVLTQGSVAVLPACVRERVKRNPHWCRLEAGGGETARVLVGDEKNSIRFKRAVQVTPEVAGLIYGGVHRPQDDTYWLDKAQLMHQSGTARRFRLFGSATRAVQAFLDDARPGDRPFRDRLKALAADAGRADHPL